MIGSEVGSYRITGKLGEGGMGAVFKGVDQMLEREVAIKMLRPDFTREPEIVERFRSEAITLAKLNHPNIATLHSFLRHDDDYFMVMEFLRGETFDSMIRRNGNIPVERALSMFNLALAGIGHAHTMGIIHRDVKPANMMLTEKGDVKVMDFGIARMLGTNRMTRQGTIIGTIQYMSPEQIQGQDTDARSDIYSLGILLYEMLTGRLPFNDSSEFKLMMMQINEPPPPPREFAPHIPLHIERAIMRSMAKRPDARFQTVNEFRQALEDNKATNAQLVNQTVNAQPSAPSSGNAAQDEMSTKQFHSGQAPAPLPVKTVTLNPAAPNQPVGVQGTHIVSPPAHLPYTANQPMNAPYPTNPPMPFTAAPYPTNPPNYASGYNQQPYGYATGPTTKRGLNWSHYVAAFLLVAMLGVGAWYFLSLGDKPQPKVQTDISPPPATQPSAPQNPVQPTPPQTITMPRPEEAGKTADAAKPETKSKTADRADSEAKTASDETPSDEAADSADRRGRKAPMPNRKEALERARKRAEARKLLDQ